MKTVEEIYNTPVNNDFIEKTIKKIKNDPGPLENPQLITQVAELYKDKQMSAPLDVITFSLTFLNIEAIEMVEEVLKQVKKVILFTERMKRVEQISKQTEFTKEDIKEVLKAFKNLTNLIQ